MFKILNTKLIMVVAATTIIGGITIYNLPALNNINTQVKNTQDSNINESDMTNLNIENNNQEINNNDEELNDNSQNNLNEQSITDYQINDENINTQENNNFQTQNTNNNVNENQINTNPIETNIPIIQYDRTTSIYTDDYTTLLRVEYYLNNKLTYYSEVEQYDNATKSYIEKIYQCNLETNDDPLIRTDIYVNGNLTNSY